jgi:hypothetical protein
VLDFDEVLARGASKPSSDQDEEGDPDRPTFSLITGRYRHAKRYGGELLYHPLSVHLFLAKIRLCTEKDRVPAPPLLSSAVVLRDQDRTIATLKDTAGVPFSLCATYQRLLLNRPLAKANFCNHELSVASKRVQGWIHLVSSNKDGAASRGAMMMTIELRMSEKHCLHKHVGKSRHCVDITVIFSALALEDSVIPSLQASSFNGRVDIFIGIFSLPFLKKNLHIYTAAYNEDKDSAE